MQVEVCLPADALGRAGEPSKMAQNNDTAAPKAALALDATADRTTDDLSIFSAPALEVVSQWWLDSKRRWTELNGPKTLVVPAVIRREAQ